MKEYLIIFLAMICLGFVSWFTFNIPLLIVTSMLTGLFSLLCAIVLICLIMIDLDKNKYY